MAAWLYSYTFAGLSRLAQLDGGDFEDWVGICRHRFCLRRNDPRSLFGSALQVQRKRFASLRPVAVDRIPVRSQRSLKGASIMLIAIFTADPS